VTDNVLTLDLLMFQLCEGQSLERIHSDTDRDFYMTPNEAKNYGLIDEVIQHKMVLPTPKIPELKVRECFGHLTDSDDKILHQLKS
jgi:hypothetical protein